MIPAPDSRIQTISELTSSIKGLLELSFPFVTVAGEISNLRLPHSGHLYFTLKDPAAQLKAVLFKTQQRYLDCVPNDGLEVVCRGRISLYEARGEYQLIVDYLAPKGTGALQLAFDLLKNRLAAEGLFAEERKKPLPLLPEKIALVTSPSGAAVHDFLSTARKRCLAAAIEIFPVPVQGAGAAEEIAAAIGLINDRAENDLIVLCRGGGSLEDMWPFNEEIVARAIAASRIPVLTGIGHEIDTSIADLVADLRAATPTAAAQAALPDRAQLCLRLEQLKGRLARSIGERLALLDQKVATQRSILGDPTAILTQFGLRLERSRQGLQYALNHALHERRHSLAVLELALAWHSPEHYLARQKQRVAELKRRLKMTIQAALAGKNTSLAGCAAILQAMSPLAVLGRGYSLARQKDGRVIRASSEVTVGEEIILAIAQGELDCRVENIRP